MFWSKLMLCLLSYFQNGLMSLKVSWYLVKIDPLQLFGDEGVVEPLQLVRRNIQPPEIGSNVLKTFTFNVKCFSNYIENCWQKSLIGGNQALKARKQVYRPPPVVRSTGRNTNHHHNWQLASFPNNTINDNLSSIFAPEWLHQIFSPLSYHASATTCCWYNNLWREDQHRESPSHPQQHYQW